MLRPFALALAAQLAVVSLSSASQAQEAAAGSPPSFVQKADPADPQRTGATGRSASPRSGRPAPAFRPPRQPRPYKVCLQRARERGLRGGDRRSFITRCQLGYGGGPSAPARR